jgi:pimeloyl-ACP methyl ester carboxylesterase
MFVTSGKARLAYDVVGEGAAAGHGGHDVLLIHAGVTDRRSWASVVERLAPRHRCISFDQRGYGETTYEHEDGWSPVDDAAAVLDAAGAGPAVVVACSMGGGRAIDLALAYPERVCGLVLIGSAASGAPWPDGAQDPVETDLEARQEAAEAAKDYDEQNRIEAWIWLDGPAAPEGRVGGAVRELFLEMNGKALRADDPGDPGERPEAWGRLGEIVVPTLVLCGRLDVSDLRAIDEQMAAEIPQGRFQWLDGVAHLPHLENDPVTLDTIEAFVDAVPLPTSDG